MGSELVKMVLVGYVPAGNQCLGELACGFASDCFL